jgi:hypothetical protein
MMKRGAAFDGRPRERLLVVGEATGLFTRLHTEDSRILHSSMGAMGEKASPERLQSLAFAERDAIDIVREILSDAMESGDLVLPERATPEEIVLSLWGLVDGTHALIEGGRLRVALDIPDPYHRVWRFFNIAADGYGWRPLFSEWDYEEVLARARQEIFPDEAQRVYGKGVWYGDRM